MRVCSIFVPLFVTLVISALPSCQSSPPKLPDSSVESNLSEELYERAPVDIAVMPVYSPVENVRGVSGPMRAHIKQSLLEKRYSPVSFQTIDDRLGAFPGDRKFDLNQIRGNFDEDALLYVTLDEWDRTFVPKHRAILVTVDFTLFDSRTGDVLWVYRASGKQMRIPNNLRAEGGQTVESHLAKLLVTEALDSLPAKDEVRTE